MENAPSIYHGLTKIDVAFDDDTVWLSLDQMAQLFQRDKSVISRHIKNIYTEGELNREGTVAKNATVQLEGMRNVERIVVPVTPQVTHQVEQNNAQVRENNAQVRENNVQVTVESVRKRNIAQISDKILTFCHEPKSILEIAEFLKYSDRRTSNDYYRKICFEKNIEQCQKL